YRTPVFSWHQFNEKFATVKNLDFHSQSTMILQPVLQEIIKQLCDWLQVKQRAASELTFLLHYEKTKHPASYKALLIRLSHPAWQPDDFLEVLTEKLA